jgi:hypothetical protein
MKKVAILKSHAVMRLNGALAYLALGVGRAVLHGWTPHTGRTTLPGRSTASRQSRQTCSTDARCTRVTCPHSPVSGGRKQECVRHPSTVSGEKRWWVCAMAIPPCMGSWRRSLSWSKGRQKLCHTALVHEVYTPEGLIEQRDMGDGEDRASGVSPERKPRGATACSQDERWGCDMWRRGAMPHFSYCVKHLKKAHIAYKEQPRLTFSKARAVSSEGEPSKGSSGGAHRTHPALGMAQPVQGSSVYRYSGRCLSQACLTSEVISSVLPPTGSSCKHSTSWRMQKAFHQDP